MTCQNHPAAAAAVACSGCAEGFCPHCVVTVRGTPYCAACKEMAVPSLPPPITGHSELAAEAFRYSVFSLFCFGFILGPLAMQKAHKAREELRQNPNLGGRGLADAATVLAGLAIALWFVGLLDKLKGAG